MLKKLLWTALWLACSGAAHAGLMSLEARVGARDAAPVAKDYKDLYGVEGSTSVGTGAGNLLLPFSPVPDFLTPGGVLLGVDQFLIASAAARTAPGSIGLTLDVWASGYVPGGANYYARASALTGFYDVVTITGVAGTKIGVRLDSETAFRTLGAANPTPSWVSGSSPSNAAITAMQYYSLVEYWWSGGSASFMVCAGTPLCTQTPGYLTRFNEEVLVPANTDISIRSTMFGLAEVGLYNPSAFEEFGGTAWGRLDSWNSQRNGITLLSDGAGLYSQSGFDYVFVPHAEESEVPEPGSLALAGLALCLACFRACTRRGQALRPLRRRHPLEAGRSAAPAALIGAMVLSIQGCGGGSGGTAASPAPAPAPAPVPAPAPTLKLTLSGTVAKGKALANAQISVKCASGSGTATSGNDGRYSLDISAATLPCAVRARSADGTETYYSVLAGSGAGSGSSTLNASPLTELVVARLAGSGTASYFDAFGASSSVSSANVSQAIATVASLLAGKVDLGTLNPISDPLVAASSGSAGNAHDQQLDALGAVLSAARSSVAELSAALAVSGATPTVAKMLLQPAAAGCPALRSGSIRLINPRETDPPWKAHVASFDATSMRLTLFNGQVVTLPAADAGTPCSYTFGSNRLMVSSAGLWFLFNSENGTRPMAFGLPEQNLPVAEFAGTWSTFLTGTDRQDGIEGVYTEPNETEYDASGLQVAARVCINLTPCSSDTPRVRLASNPAGGFDALVSGSAVARFYMFKAPGGEQLIIAAANDASTWLIGTRKRALGALPSVGQVARVWDYSQDGTGSAAAPVVESLTVTSVDGAARRYTLQRGSGVQARNGRIEPIDSNQPRDGLWLRRSGSCTMSGASSSCAQVIGMPLQGMGATLYNTTAGTGPESSRFGVMVDIP